MKMYKMFEYKRDGVRGYFGVGSKIYLKNEDDGIKREMKVSFDIGELVSWKWMECYEMMDGWYVSEDEFENRLVCENKVNDVNVIGENEEGVCI